MSLWAGLIESAFGAALLATPGTAAGAWLTKHGLASVAASVGSAMFLSGAPTVVSGCRPMSARERAHDASIAS